MNTTSKATPAAKAGNWSAADLKALDAYIAGNNSTEQLQALCPAKTVAAIRSKLVSLSKYVKADPATKAMAEGKALPAKKLAIVGTIETLLGLPAESLPSLEKASKQELQRIADQLVSLSERQAADQGDYVAQYVATMPADQDPQAVTVEIDGYRMQDIITSGM
jgi:hypothetical protein